MLCASAFGPENQRNEPSIAASAVARADLETINILKSSLLADWARTGASISLHAGVEIRLEGKLCGDLQLAWWIELRNVPKAAATAVRVRRMKFAWFMASNAWTRKSNKDRSLQT